jgi:hypothetical protein
VNGWMEPKMARPLAEAIDEVFRELCVRKRCFPKWITEGRVSGTDAQDRIDRLATAWELLTAMANTTAQEPVTSTGDKTEA